MVVEAGTSDVAIPLPPVPKAVSRSVRSSNIIGTTQALIGKGTSYLRTGEPGCDSAQPSWLDTVDPPAAIGIAGPDRDEPGIAEQPELARHSRPAQANFFREFRRLADAERKQRDQLSPGWVGQQLDSGTISLGHGVILASRP